MTILNKLTIKNLKLNKKRTIVTIIGIILSVALIAAVATMYASGLKSLIVYEKTVNGNFHVAFKNVSKDNIKDMTYDEISYLSFYHIPKLSEILELTKDVPIILSLKLHTKNEELFKLLDNYSGKFALLSTDIKIIMWLNKHRENYIVGEVITKHKGFNLGFYFIKSDFKSYNIEYYDKIKLNKLREENIVVGYYVNNKNSLKTYNNMFDSLIIDNYIGITSR